jgi:hypothetical protein
MQNKISGISTHLDEILDILSLFKFYLTDLEYNTARSFLLSAEESITNTVINRFDFSVRACMKSQRSVA